MMAATWMKIVTVEDLLPLREEFRRTGTAVGLCHGCFDILHPGHLHHFEQAAAQVGVLVVSVTAGRHIDKGPGRPVFDNAARQTMVAALAVTDYVVLSQAPTARDLIGRLRPDVFFKGADYLTSTDSRLDEERRAAARAGARYVTTDGSVFDSSTRAARVIAAEADSPNPDSSVLLPGKARS